MSVCVKIAQGLVCLGVYLACLAVADWKTANEYYNYAMEWQTSWGCKVVGFINVFAATLSIASMLMIAFEIYYNARFAFYGRRMSPSVAYGAICVGYAYAFVMAGEYALRTGCHIEVQLCPWWAFRRTKRPAFASHLPFQKPSIESTW